MKLLLDENLSRRIIPALQNTYPGSSQVVALLDLNETNDIDIWEYAKKESYAIVTQDADFNAGPYLASFDQQNVITK